MSENRKTFLYLLKKEFDEKCLDYEKAKLYFSENEFVIDKFIKQFDDKVVNAFYDCLDLNVSYKEIERNVSKLQSNLIPKVKQCLQFFYKKTIFGMLKICNEYDPLMTYKCPMKNDYGVYRFAWFQHVMASQAELQGHRWLAGQEPEILAVSIPPQHTKTTIICALIAMLMGNRPSGKALMGAYSQDYAQKIMDKDMYNIIASNGYQKLYGKIFAAHIDKKERMTITSSGGKVPTDTKDLKKTIGGGRIFAASIKQLTGNPAQILCIDDPIPSFDVARNPEEIKHIVDEFSASAMSRTRSHTLVCIVQTRWTRHDVIGFLLDYDEKLKESGEKSIIKNMVLRSHYDPTDDFDYDFRTFKNQELWPEVCHKPYTFQKLMNPYVFNALYMQRPLDESGVVFDKAWFNRYLPHEIPDEFVKVCISIDTSYNDKKTSDKAAFLVFGITVNGLYYLIDMIYDRMTFKESVQEVHNIIEKHPYYTECLVEPKANGQALIESLQEIGVRVIAAESPTESKLSRASAISPIIQSGKLYIPKHNLGDEYLSQMISFTGQGKHEKDDLVDATVQVMLFYDKYFKNNFSIKDVRIFKIDNNRKDFSEYGITRNPAVSRARLNANNIIKRLHNKERYGMRGLLRGKR